MCRLKNYSLMWNRAYASTGCILRLEKPLGLVLYFHGNSRSIKGWAKYAVDFYRYKYDVVLVDYRGFGKSTGKRNEKDMLNDMQFVYETLAAKYTTRTTSSFTDAAWAAALQPK